MPATSKSQQRLMGWALACKRGEQKNCPPNVQKLADDMTESDLEKYAKTSHEGLPDQVEEAVVEAAIYELYKVNEGAIKHLLMLAAEASDFEAFKTDANEWMASQGNEPLSDDYLQDVFTNAESWNEKMEENMNESEGALNVDAQTMTTTEKIPGQGDSVPPPPSGMDKGDKIKDALTPSLYKAPMGKKGTLNQRVMDWDQLLKTINYKTHDGTMQRGHGQNLQGNGSE